MKICFCVDLFRWNIVLKYFWGLTNTVNCFLFVVENVILFSFNKILKLSFSFFSKKWHLKNMIYNLLMNHFLAIPIKKFRGRTKNKNTENLNITWLISDFAFDLVKVSSIFQLFALQKWSFYPPELFKGYI